MSDARWERLKAILEELLECPTGERESRLRACAGGDESLAAELRSMLSDAERLGSFLADPTHLRALVPGSTVALTPPEDADPRADALPETIDVAAAGAAPRGDGVSSEERPTYRLTGLLGRGGFGEVYRAEQLTPVRCTVALKFLRIDRSSRHHRLRFEAERQALAMLSHEGIARLLDAGTTPDGRLYYATEFVEGSRLDRYCDERRLGVRARLALFRRLCDAIQHAHLRGIVHRDLKPENILVAERDGVAIPRVIDFGLAKSLERPLSEELGRTEEGWWGGTLPYMSPEQAGGSPGAIDVRADIYALGAILHELLVGVLPLEFPAGIADHERLRIIHEVEPARPSARLRRLDADRAAEIAAARRTTPEALARSLAPELDWIVLRALEKSAEARYQSAGELAEELRRVLEHEPVLVVPPTLGYQVGKFIRRNRGAVLAAAATLVTAVIGLSTTAAFWAVAREEGELSRLLEDRSMLEDARVALRVDGGLWPITAQIIPALETLRGRIAEVRSRRPEYEAVVRIPLDDDTSEVERFRRKIVEEVLAICATEESAERRESLTAEIDWRLGNARTLAERTVTGPEARARWAAAIRDMQDAERCPLYRGMAPIAPQLGLLPLGRDPVSGLHEFWHILSGEEPLRGEDGRIRMRPEDGIVLVLIPGGEYVVGCEPPIGFYADRKGAEFIVAAVPEWSPAREAELPLQAGIRSIAVDGVPCKIREAVSRLAEGGGEVTLELGVDGEEAPRTARYRMPPPGDDRIYDPNAKTGQGPSQAVRLDPYFIGKFELTQGQWVRWTGRNPSECQAEAGSSPDRVHTFDQPVEAMSWPEAVEQLRRWGLALPTEAQWEVACRAGTVTPFATGKHRESLEGHANIADIRYAQTTTGNPPEAPYDDGFAYSAPVGSYPPNAFGLHDVHGNVWEWCREVQVWYEGAPPRDGDGLRENPAVSTGERILRGGGYKNGPQLAAVGYRWPYKIVGDGDVGIRPARPLDPPNSP